MLAFPSRTTMGGRLIFISCWSALRRGSLGKGSPPQIAQRILRHADCTTTIKNYTLLSLEDDAAALQRIGLAEPIPSNIPSSQSTNSRETVTEDARSSARAAQA